MIMAIDRRLLEILCCPVSRRPLRMLGKAQQQWLNDAIAAGTVLDVNGRTVSAAFDSGLITDDGKVIYRIDDDIPVLLPEDGIGTTQFHGFPH
jgi:uncharacterized protein YbaR (Trm112 family)